MGYLQGKRILVTGGAGFLGRAVCAQLEACQPAAIIAPRQREFDLRKRGDIESLFQKHAPEIVLHLAAVVGGIGANRVNPGRYFYDNAIMGIELIEQCRVQRIEKVVVVGTICSYPKFTPVPFREEDFWNGYPEETNAPYGLAKKMLAVQAQAYRQQYGLNAITLLPVNLYGPHDNFDPDTSHVVPALIRKVHQAQLSGQPWIDVWGSGSASREFLFVRDAAQGVIQAAELYNDQDVVNVGSGREITIHELVESICQLSGFEGEVHWDRSKPDGQPRRCLDTSRAERCFGFRASTTLRDGLLETIQWYRSTHDHLRVA